MGFALVGKQGDVSVLRRRDYGAEVLALLLLWSRGFGIVAEGSISRF
jgi:hypothetical protein